MLNTSSRRQPDPQVFFRHYLTTHILFPEVREALETACDLFQLQDISGFSKHISSVFDRVGSNAHLQLSQAVRDYLETFNGKDERESDEQESNGDSSVDCPTLEDISTPSVEQLEENGDFELNVIGLAPLEDGIGMDFMVNDALLPDESNEVYVQDFSRAELLRQYADAKAAFEKELQDVDAEKRRRVLAVIRTQEELKNATDLVGSTKVSTPLPGYGLKGEKIHDLWRDIERDAAVAKEADSSALIQGEPTRGTLRRVCNNAHRWSSRELRVLTRGVQRIASTLEVDIDDEAVIRGWGTREWAAVLARVSPKLDHILPDEAMCYYVNSVASWAVRWAANWDMNELGKLNNAIMTTTSWSEIAKLVGGFRTPLSCLRCYVYHSNPEFNRGKFNDLEKETWGRAVKVLGHSSWQSVALVVGTRDRIQCREHYECTLERKLGTWTIMEDAKLRSAIAKHGPTWALVAKEMEGRTRKQCRERFESEAFAKCNRGIIGNKDRTFYTRWRWKEDVLLVVMKTISKQDIGLETNSNSAKLTWAEISRFFTNRAANQCQRRWKRMLLYSKNLRSARGEMPASRKAWTNEWYPTKLASPEDIKEYVRSAQRPIHIPYQFSESDVDPAATSKRVRLTEPKDISNEDDDRLRKQARLSA